MFKLDIKTQLTLSNFLVSDSVYVDFSANLILGIIPAIKFSLSICKSQKLQVTLKCTNNIKSLLVMKIH